MSKNEEFEKMTLEMGGEVIKLTPGKENYLDVFGLNKNRNEYKEDFELAIHLNPMNERETLILNYGIRQGKIEGNNDFNKLLKAILEAYPKSEAEYVDFDTYCRELINRSLVN